MSLGYEIEELNIKIGCSGHSDEYFFLTIFDISRKTISIILHLFSSCKGPSTVVLILRQKVFFIHCLLSEMYIFKKQIIRSFNG